MSDLLIKTYGSADDICSDGRFWKVFEGDPGEFKPSFEGKLKVWNLKEEKSVKL